MFQPGLQCNQDYKQEERIKALPLGEVLEDIEQPGLIEA